MVYTIIIYSIYHNSDKLNDCVDPDSLNKAVALLLGHALGNNANDNPTMVSSI